VGVPRLEIREKVLFMFIGPQFSNLYAVVDTPAKAAWLCVRCN
jgi:hypothetical protein